MIEEPTDAPTLLGRARSLHELEGTFRGTRAFIIGDTFDPSCRAFDLLRGEFTIAVNGFYEHYDRMTWKASLHVVTRDLVDDRIAGELNGVTGSTLCVETDLVTRLRPGPGVIPFDIDAIEQRSARVAGVALGSAPMPEVRGPDRSLAVALQIAHHLGFDPIYLVAPDVDRAWGARTNSGSHRANALAREEMVAWHLAHRQAAESAGRTIVNLSDGVLPNVYRRANPVEVLGSTKLTEFGRDQAAHVDETEVVAYLFDRQPRRRRTMVDVGAHRGTSARFFVEKPWTIYCFEPDPANRAQLEKRLGSRDTVTIDSRAVGDVVADDLPFYTSGESSGISALSAFRSSHEETRRVAMTTIADIVDEYGIERIDFLKIDVEGFDLAVLKGVPWDRLKPTVIECEYEDAKTVPLGHTTCDIAAYLHERGYKVYLSEWHPIIRYGVPHDWRRVIPHPGFDVPANSWGNLLAFKRDPGYEAVLEAFAALVRTGRPEATAPPRRPAAPADTSPPARTSAPSPSRPAQKRPLYARPADRLRTRSPAAYAFLRACRRLALRQMRHRALAVGVGVFCFAVLLAGFFVDSNLWRDLLWIGTTLLFAIAAAGVAAAYAFRLGQRQAKDRRDLDEVRARLSALEARNPRRGAGR